MQTETSHLSVSSDLSCQQFQRSRAAVSVVWHCHHNPAATQLQPVRITSVTQWLRNQHRSGRPSDDRSAGLRTA